MTNIEQTIKAQREEFEKRFIGNKKLDLLSPLLNGNDVKSWNNQSIKQILEVLVEEEEKEKLFEVDGYYSQAKQYTITRLKEAIALLDKKEL